MKKTLLLILLACAGFLASAQQQILPNDPEVRRGVLENGMNYYIRHNALPEGRAEFYLVTDAGAIQENPAQDGLAHFLEHMCFNGTKNFPGKSLLTYLQGIGAEFGRNINASTGVEMTQYMLNNIPVSRQGIVDTCLLVMHDYSHFVNCEPSEIDAERGVIIEEKRTRNDARWRMREKASPYYYGDSKYATCTIIGSQENLETFAPETLVDFYHTWYRPDLQALIVVGDINVDLVEARIKDIFSDIPAVENPKPKDIIKIPDSDTPVAAVLTDPEYSGTSIELLWRSDALPKEMRNTVAAKMLDLTKAYVSLIMRERFNDLSVDADCPFMSASLGMGDLTNTSEIIMGNVSCKEGKAEEALRLFMTEFEKMRRYGFSDAEVGRVTENIISMYEHEAETAATRKNPDFIKEYINNFISNTPYMVPEQELEMAKAICTQINARILGQVVSTFGGDKNMVVLLKAREKEDQELPAGEKLLSIINEVRASEIQPNAEEEAIAELMDAGALKGSKSSKVKKDGFGASTWTLKNGLKVVVLPTDYKKDDIVAKLVWNGGVSLIPTSDLPSFEDNIWSLFQSNTGLSSFSGTQLPKMLAGKNCSASISLSGYSHGITGASTVKDFETMLQLFYLTIAEPRFDEKEYELGKSQIANVLPNIKVQPAYRLENEMRTTMYGDNPRKLGIDEDVLSKASISVVEKNCRMLFHDAAGATLFVVGDVNIDVVKPLIDKYLGSIAKGRKPLEWKNVALGIQKGEIVNHFSTKMQVPKNTVVQIYTGYMPFTVQNKVMLDAVQYMLNMIYVDTLREEEGGTYGAHVSATYSHIPVGRALIQVSFDTNPQQAPRLCELARKGINDLAANGPTEEQLTRTIENFKKKIPEQRITNGYWMTMLTQKYMYDIDYDAQYERAVREITSENVKSLLAEILGQGNFIEVEMSPEE
ncbi:MAG: insulinase family protein [Bacteroidales bacterium]|nr:insulinase family protein [Bacteroidales bacterium]